MPRVDNKEFYSEAMQKHGENANGLHWISKETQNIRFKAILEMLPSNLNQLTLLDAGCGFGDFYIYLKNNNKLPKEYKGVDSLEYMCNIASKKTKCETIVADITKDQIPNAQYIVCSGAMNILNKFETYQFIRNCYISSENGFIFNILHGNKKSDTYNYVTTTELKQIAKDLGVVDMKIKTGYLKSDITVGFFHQKTKFINIFYDLIFRAAKNR